HKRTRNLLIGSNIRLFFEDGLTIHYQIQEMLRAERIFEKAGIEEELAAYNPLIPDGRNWKATMMIEYPNPDERREALRRLVGVENRVWIKIEGADPVYAVADEDMARDTEEKTSSVHFLRFELDEDMATKLKSGAALSIGIDHPAYSHTVGEVSESLRASLASDLD
ncbi:MAG: DUF3501 family protein, partial [Gammaproteobacteria bacterium]|nr:DUF3501 family protein [Gammaproteobacteria bacterium]